MPGLKALVDGDEVAFANRVLAIGVAGDLLEQGLAFGAYFSDLGDNASLFGTRAPGVELRVVAVATCIQLTGQYLQIERVV